MGAWRQTLALLALLALAAAPQGVLAVTITNIATAEYEVIPGDPPVLQNSNAAEVTTGPAPTPAVVTFWQYAPPGMPAEVSYRVDGGEYDAGGAVFVPLPAPRTLRDQPIPVSGPVPLREAQAYHAGEPVFITLTDANRNADPLVREIIELEVTTSTGDVERLRLVETGPDTGIFAAVIPSRARATAVTSNDGQLALDIDQRIDVRYVDPGYPADVAIGSVLVDPLGRVFDSSTGALLNGVTVSLLNADTGLPALVFGDDGVSAYPSTVQTGSTVTDGGGQVYQLPLGTFRFPFVAPGNYRFAVTPLAPYTAPSTVAPGSLPPGPVLDPFLIDPVGSYGGVFEVVPGPPLMIDIPADPPALGSTLLLQKSVAVDTATIGDFVRYTLVLENRGAMVANGTQITDQLPAGLRYEPGSLRVDGLPVPEPTLSVDGRTLTMTVGVLAPGATVRANYVLRVVAAGGGRQAINRARATEAGGAFSNEASASVRLTDFLMSNAATVIGRVVESPCDTPWDQLKGVPNVRLLLEDGTYVTTDRDGLYHVEGLKPGTHVVQLDLVTLPAGYEPQVCQANTRFANRPFAQFVEVAGGALWRADFYVKPKPAPAPLPDGEAGLRLETLPDVESSTTETPMQEHEYTFRGQFAACEDTLLPGSVGELTRLLATLRKGRVERLAINGHSDTLPLSAACSAKFTDNEGLSRARAATVAGYLAEGLGLGPAQVTTAGYGASQPLVANNSAANMAKNRRVEVVAFSRAPAPGGVRDSRTRRQHRLSVDTAGVPADNVRAMVLLPPALTYVPGSARLDGASLADPQQAEGVLTWRLPGRLDAGSRALVFATEARVVTTPVDTDSFQGQFVACGAQLSVASYEELRALAQRLRQSGSDQLRIITSLGSRPLSPACQAQRVDPAALARARAQTLAEQTARALGVEAQRVRIASPKQTADRGGRADEVELRVSLPKPARAAAADACAAGYSELKALVSLEAAAGAVRLPAVSNRLPCGVGEAFVPDSGRVTAVLARPAAAAAPTAAADPAVAPRVDWLARAVPGETGFLLPEADQNPRAPAIRVVVQHAPGQQVELTVNGVPASAINFDGASVDRARGTAVSVWRGLPIGPGANELVARVYDKERTLLGEYTRAVHFANDPVRLEFVPEQSVLVADGITRPRLAVRLLDHDDKPVRGGMTLSYRVAAPYQPYEAQAKAQERQLAGLDRYRPQVSVAGDDGIAFIELAPTTQSGEAVFSFSLQTGATQTREQEIRAWLSAQPRDWVLVGFAEGTAGYRTLEANSTALPAEADAGGYTDGRVSVYAKGRVLGQWLLTMAYDSGKADDRGRLLSTIDPGEFYTLYGDGAEQRYDAASQRKLYLKLERGQFYALFGDYETGLTVTELSRYSRTLNGLKIERGGQGVTVSAFAAQTAQDAMRDELRGNGTSGLYRLSRSGIVINSEGVTLEVRDRYTGAVLSTRALARHLDYDIDYGAGTLFFREPIASRDGDLNPQFIVVRYETWGAGAEEVTAGGRVAVDLAGGRAEVGVSAVTETQLDSDQQLLGVDASVQIGEAGELRAEAAQTDGQEASLDKQGSAALVAYEHHGARVDALAYLRRQEPGFGLRQQNATDVGMQKAGVEGQYRLDEQWALTGEVARQDNLSSTAVRETGAAGVRWTHEATELKAGVQVARDESALGEQAQSEQLNVGARHALLNRRLELSAVADLGLGEGNSANSDYPDRLTLGASYALSTAARLIATQEFTAGADYDTRLTRAGVQVSPWGGARLESTLNQQDISEYGPRTFAQFGLTQSLLEGERWGADVTFDSSQTLHETGVPTVVVNPNQPSAVAGGEATTDDYLALSAGLTYRAPQWSWNGRVETRDGSTSERQGLVTHFLRQATAGIAVAADAQLFAIDERAGTTGRDLTLGAGLAYRPLGARWSILERLEVKYESIEDGLAQGGLFGYDSLDVAGQGRSTRIINNLALNRVSGAWTAADREGNLFALNQRHQFSLYYGAKYVRERIDGADYRGYTDLLAAESRHDLSPRWDVGVQASALHAWEPGTVSYSFGPSVGYTPFTNAWITVGYNVRGFEDPDFTQARWTAEGLYLKVRLKFDQTTRWRDLAEPPYALAPAGSQDLRP